MPHFLLKTEPSSYSYDDLERDGTAVWDGVSNPAALKQIRAMRAGDRAFIYHTGAEKRIVGIARVTADPRPDPKAGDPRLVVVDLAPVERMTVPVTLATVKADGRFADWELVRVPRLSVMPVSAERWKAVLALSK